MGTLAEEILSARLGRPVHAEAVEGTGDRLFLRRGEVGAGELLALAQGGINDRHMLNRHHEPPGE